MGHELDSFLPTLPTLLTTLSFALDQDILTPPPTPSLGDSRQADGLAAQGTGIQGFLMHCVCPSCPEEPPHLSRPCLAVCPRK